MSEFGLTGGIGSGKSAASERLVALGAGLVDADATVKQLQRAGMPVFLAIVAHFGDGVVGGDGELDRPSLADIVFNDPEELKKINELVHPAVRTDMARQRKALSKTHEIIVLDIPLLIDSENQIELAGIVVVDTPTDVAIERLTTLRGFSTKDANARISSQVSRETRLAKADFVVDNSASLAALDDEIARCWQWMGELHQAAGQP
ncbi:MAG: dephospho-CoA kinase [Acidimicrobiales bacterium]